jgi:hypothetical protein
VRDGAATEMAIASRAEQSGAVRSIATERSAVLPCCPRRPLADLCLVKRDLSHG